MKRVIVHIDRLVLKGFRPQDRHAIAAGLRQELARAFADREIVPRFRAMGNVSQLKVDGALFEQGLKPHRIGQRAAHAIGDEIKK